MNGSTSGPRSATRKGTLCASLKPIGATVTRPTSSERTAMTDIPQPVTLEWIAR
jgi:hypothetical protein